ncbi:hypothetical protein PHISCL_01745 [Aspergillus sclerotialis]|uniref:MYND-type domain-containing protein n=1 Tax=Aspergillus sclerotialis TaxID=2070753 RepID=A0A3A2ZUA3_9EURO|nr:hypothetical protein PHISCL_01745 [Aspergillus sclerotialis]
MRLLRKDSQHEMSLLHPCTGVRRSINNTYYCNKRCQDKDWERHKHECRKLHERKKLHRAACLLQEIMYHIRMQAAPPLFRGIHADGSTIYLNGYRHLRDQTTKLLEPFPIPYDANRSEGEKQNFEAALVYMGCLETMVYLEEWVNAIFTGNNYHIKEANVRIANPVIKFIGRYPSGETVEMPVGYHNLYKVTYKNGETWAIDPSGAQFGFFNPLTPWHNYIAARTVSGADTYPLGVIQSNAYDGCITQPVRVIVAQTVQNVWFVRCLAQKLPQLEGRYGGNLANVLRGTDSVFEEQKEEFLGMLDDCIKASMEELYSDEMMAKMNEIIEEQLEKNKANPDSQVRMEEVMQFMSERF